MRSELRLAEATADFARRSSAWPTFKAARISDPLAFCNETFTCLTETIFVLLVTIEW